MLELIRFFGGAPTWCAATLTEQGKPVDQIHVCEGAEGLGPLRRHALEML